MLNTIKALGLGQFYDNTGYNVLEIPYEEYPMYQDALYELILKYPNLMLAFVDQYGNIGANTVGDDLTLVVFDPEVWDKNGIEWLNYTE